jgi:hypothetical protein
VLNGSTGDDLLVGGEDDEDDGGDFGDGGPHVMGDTCRKLEMQSGCEF